MNPAAPPAPSLDPSELLALMPFAVQLGITLDEATADRIAATSQAIITATPPPAD